MRTNGNTRIYGLFGYPVKHTFSPGMHNAAFRKIGFNAIYFPFEVKPEDLKDALRAVKVLGISGLNLTIPHKESCIRYLDGLSSEAKLIGAVNTIVADNKRLVGYNTDGEGFIISLKKDAHVDPGGKKIFILGAGGAAKAIGFKLAKEGAAKIKIADIIRKRSLSLASNIKSNFSGCKVEVIRMDSISKLLADVDIFINATPIGLKHDDPLLIHPDLLHPKLVVCDLIYNPPQTKLLKCAMNKGLISINGLGMLLYQGAVCFELWTKKKAPIEIMKEALKNSL